ncbi:MAG TPA: hypothetical protein DEF47_04785 [Herpetosiphon sp.]|uniref:Uncharacterized protein n=1 Tax=Herpetosiphon aurantiacus (strain ATCC 23779 / DSM 785 / 114-95) TaxID=316274 RepID=A9B350_HERA2|nr:hypothetical protein [Herpetosiphon sp.]ABX07513.1 hypothetical protein Haur_4883 [Herpetosiphon aurantiacus DSM 785]HBW49198.1 hypothetical protein [Herpetosiphon sp.]
MRLLVAAFLAFMLSTTGFFTFLPSAAKLTTPLVCNGGTIIPPASITRKSKFYCEKNGTQSLINPFLLLASGALVYTPLFYLALLLVKPKQTTLGGQQPKQPKPSKAVVDIQNQAQFARSLAGTAQVLDTEKGRHISSNGFRRDVEVILTLDVQRPDGSSYQAQSAWMVEELQFARIAIGNTIPVQIDADDPMVIYPSREFRHIKYSLWYTSNYF